MSDSKLDEVFVDEKYGTYRRNIDGMIEHAYYHNDERVSFFAVMFSSYCFSQFRIPKDFSKFKESLSSGKK